VRSERQLRSNGERPSSIPGLRILYEYTRRNEDLGSLRNKAQNRRAKIARLRVAFNVATVERPHTQWLTVSNYMSGNFLEFQRRTTDL
jgi:hypothetical protein